MPSSSTSHDDFRYQMTGHFEMLQWKKITKTFFFVLYVSSATTILPQKIFCSVSPSMPYCRSNPQHISKISHHITICRYFFRCSKLEIKYILLLKNMMRIWKKRNSRRRRKKWKCFFIIIHLMNKCIKKLYISISTAAACRSCSIEWLYF